MEDQLKKIQEKVEKQLEKDSRCRENDLWLMLNVWWAEGYKVYVPYESIEEMTPAESITRARRKIQQEGRLLPEDPAVIIKRRINAEIVRNFFAGKTEKLAQWEKLYNDIGHKESQGIKRKKYFG
jgi:hypothetical protein